MRTISRAGSRLPSASPATSRALRASVAFGFAAFGFLTSAEAFADTQSCVTAHASGQREAKAGRLKLASELYTSCGSDSACPEQLRAECTELLEKTRAATPSVILSVLDENGADMVAVKVYSTEELIADTLDGRAMALDPGKHHLRFILPGGEVLSSDVLVREGEKNRLIQVRVEPKVKAPELAATPTATEPAAPALPPPPPPAKPPVAAWVATGFAIAGAGVFGTFAYLGSQDKKDLDACAPSCSRTLEGTRDSMKTKYLVADIGLGAAAVSTAVAVYLFATHGSSGPKASDTARAPRFVAGLSAGPSGGGLVLSGDFR